MDTKRHQTLLQHFADQKVRLITCLTESTDQIATGQTAKQKQSALPAWTEAKVAVFDSSSDKEHTNESTISAGGRILNTDLIGNDSANAINELDSSVWATTAPSPDLSDSWSAPSPKTDLQTAPAITQSQITDTTDHVYFFNSLSPISKMNDSRHSWTPAHPQKHSHSMDTYIRKDTQTA